MTVFFFAPSFSVHPASHEEKTRSGRAGRFLKTEPRSFERALCSRDPSEREIDGAEWWRRTTAPLIRSGRGPLPCLSAEFWMCHIRLSLLLRHRGLTGTFFSPPLSFSTHPRVPLRILGMLSSLSRSWQVHCGQWDLFLWPAGCQERQPISNQSGMSCWNKEAGLFPPFSFFLWRHGLASLACIIKWGEKGKAT